MLFDYALASALGQLDVEIEVVVVCDGAPDSLVRRVQEFGDPRVKVVRHREARGVASARNAGIDAATADWVAILDDDDLWAPTKLAVQVAAANAVDAGFAYCSAVIVDEQLRVKSLTPAPPPPELLSQLLARNTMPGGGSNIIARRDLLQSVGGFDASMWYMSDWDMALRLAIASTGARVRDPLVAWVRHAGATAPMLERVRQDVGVLEERYREHALRHNVRLDDAAILSWVGNSELESGRSGYRARAARAFAEGAWIGRRPTDIAHVGRAVLGRQVDAMLRAHLKERPPTPTWLTARSSAPFQPANSSAETASSSSASGLERVP